MRELWVLRMHEVRTVIFKERDSERHPFCLSLTFNYTPSYVIFICLLLILDLFPNLTAQRATDKRPSQLRYKRETGFLAERIDMAKTKRWECTQYIKGMEIV